MISKYEVGYAGGALSATLRHVEAERLRDVGVRLLIDRMIALEQENVALRGKVAAYEEWVDLTHSRA